MVFVCVVDFAFIPWFCVFVVVFRLCYGFYVCVVVFAFVMWVLIFIMSVLCFCCGFAFVF